MKTAAYVTLAFLVILLAGVTPASAHGHFRTNLFIGPVWGPGWWYYPPPQQTVIVERSPEVYLQQPAQSSGDSGGYWYYCKDAKAYYPYVKQCPGGWTKVAPSPPPEDSEE